MTKQQSIDFIAGNIDGLGGVQASARANLVYDMALYKLGKIPVVPWNKAEETITLTSGTSVYAIPGDILTDYNNGDVKGIVSLWRTDAQDREVSIVDRDYFNSYHRGSTTTGEPILAMQYWDSDTLKIEFHYVPDDNYSLWAYIRKTLKYEDIPEEHQDIVAYRGIMLANIGGSPSYGKGKELYLEAMEDIVNQSIEVWDGKNIKPAFAYGHYGNGRMKVDSQNYYRLI